MGTPTGYVYKNNDLAADCHSLFVHLPGATREEAFQIGEEIARRVTEDNPYPVTLQFEKVLF